MEYIFFSIYAECEARSVAGNWLFCGREWLDPSRPVVKAKLEQRHSDLCARFPAFSSCSKALFLDAIATVSASWSARLRECEEQGGKPTRTQGLAATPPPPPCSLRKPDKDAGDFEGYPVR